MAIELDEHGKPVDPYYCRCEYCKNRGPVQVTHSGSGPCYECWCHLDGIPGPTHDLFGKGCERWSLSDKYESVSKKY